MAQKQGVRQTINNVETLRPSNKHVETLIYKHVTIRNTDTKLERMFHEIIISIQFESGPAISIKAINRTFVHTLKSVATTVSTSNKIYGFILSVNIRSPYAAGVANLKQ